jgi:tRNA pseudouridine55 synthase
MSVRSGRSGILLIDKPQGITSHDVVSRTRKLAGTKKVGHAGTLDPMATGLLVLGLNSSTRLLTYLVGLDKEYFATIRLGQSTTTDDAEGTTTGGGDASGLSIAAIESALEPLRGEISQVPSSVSAIKVDGKRAYDLVREGEAVELKSRSVTVSALEVLAVRQSEFTDLDVRVECSSGTYIRAIARDLGETLGVGGHLTALRRTRIGPFGIEAASTLEAVDVDSALLAPADVAGRLFPIVQLDEQQTIDLAHGKRLSVGHDDGEPVAAITPSGQLAGLITIADGRARPLVNFPSDEVLD